MERRTPATRESPDAYTTPAVARRDGKTEIVVTGGDVVTGHDPATGRELWRASGLNPDDEGNYRVVASPVAVGDLVVAPTRVRPMLVLRAFGRGDVTKSHLLWTFDRGPDVPTPATDGKHLYVVTDRGVLWCLDLETGKPFYGPERLAVGTYSSSPLLADGKLYLTSEDGAHDRHQGRPCLRAPGRESSRRVHGELPRRRRGPALREDAGGALLHRPRITVRAPRPARAAGRPAGGRFHRSS